MRRWPQIALGRFRLVIRRHFFLGRVVRQWLRLCREGGGLTVPGGVQEPYRCATWGHEQWGWKPRNLGFQLNAPMDLFLLLCISELTPHSPAHTNIHPCTSLPVWSFSVCQLNLGWVQGAVGQVLYLHVSPSLSAFRTLLHSALQLGSLKGQVSRAMMRLAPGMLYSPTSTAPDCALLHQVLSEHRYFLRQTESKVHSKIALLVVTTPFGCCQPHITNCSAKSLLQEAASQRQFPSYENWG